MRNIFRGLTAADHEPDRHLRRGSEAREWRLSQNMSRAAVGKAFDRGDKAAALQLRARLAQREPDDVRHDAVQRLRQDERHGVVRRQAPAPWELVEHEIDALPRARRLVHEVRAEGLRGEPDLRARQRHPDNAWDLDLVPLAVGRARGPAAREVRDERRLAAVTVVELEP